MKKYKVKILPQAEYDLASIGDYISNELSNQLSAQKILSRILAACNSLSTFPHRSPVFYEHSNKKLRAIHIKNYTIVYHVDDNSRSVEILAVIYSRRDIEKLLEGR